MRNVQQIFKESKTIAVVGLSSDPAKDSLHVSEYMQQQGYRIIPVNPKEQEVLGEKAYPDLKSVPVPVDIVDVFRRPDATPSIATEAVAIKAKALWLQLGIANDEAASTATRGGLDVVMDKCIMVEHQRLRAQGKL
ncbi:MAG: CoA-binding protein [Chloroflexi bacterium]|nr:CoA-binding protein [Chloroflexota bacterium]